MRNRATSSRASSASSALEIVEGHPGHVGQQRSEAAALGGAAVHRQRAEGETVKAILDGYHAGPPGGGARQLDGALDGLGAAVDEHDAVGRGGGDAHQRLGEQAGQVGQAELGEAGGLQVEQVGQGGVHRGVVAAYVVHAEAAEPVEVFDARGVVQVSALGARPRTVEAEDLEDLHETRVGVVRVEGHALAGSRRQEPPKAELVVHVSPRFACESRLGWRPSVECSTPDSTARRATANLHDGVRAATSHGWATVGRSRAAHRLR